MSNPVPWITTADKVVGKGHPTLPDVANRVFRFILTSCGIDPDAALGFIGFSPVFNARAFGAIGDGVADDTLALQAMLDSIGSNSVKGHVGVIPPGTYKVTSPLIPPARNAYMDSSKHVVKMWGATLFPYGAVASLFDLSNKVNTEGHLTLIGGTIDGVNASATTTGIIIRQPNVRLDRMVVRNCGGPGFDFIYDVPSSLAPLCCEVNGCYSERNKIGLRANVPTSVLKISGGRFEHNLEENILVDGCGKVCFTGVVAENSGEGPGMSSKSNLRIRNAVDGFVSGCYFESNPYQDHSCVAIEGLTDTPRAILFTGNRVVGYATDAAGNPLLNSIGLDAGPGAGAANCVVAFSNYYFGHTTAVRIGTNCRGSEFGPDDFADAWGSAPAWNGATAYALGNIVLSGGITYSCILAHTNQAPPNATYWVAITLKRYDLVSTWPSNYVSDMNRHASAIYVKGVFQELLATGLTISGGLAAAGKLFKSATLGFVVSGIAGSASDLTFLTPSLAAVMEVPTTTAVAQFFSSVQESAVVLAYSASITPNVGVGTAAGTTGNIQTITATNGTAFTINAPTGARAGMRLRIRVRNTSGGALGVATWNAVFKMVAWVQPANGFSRTIDFDYDGTNWVEATRASADIAN